MAQLCWLELDINTYTDVTTMCVLSICVKC